MADGDTALVLTLSPDACRYFMLVVALHAQSHSQSYTVAAHVSERIIVRVTSGHVCLPPTAIISLVNVTHYPGLLYTVASTYDLTIQTTLLTLSFCEKNRVTCIFYMSHIHTYESVHHIFHLCMSFVLELVLFVEKSPHISNWFISHCQSSCSFSPTSMMTSHVTESQLSQPGIHMMLYLLYLASTKQSGLVSILCCSRFLLMF